MKTPNPFDKFIIKANSMPYLLATMLPLYENRISFLFPTVINKNQRQLLLINFKCIEHEINMFEIEQICDFASKCINNSNVEIIWGYQDKNGKKTSIDISFQAFTLQKNEKDPEVVFCSKMETRDKISRSYLFDPNPEERKMIDRIFTK